MARASLTIAATLRGFLDIYPKMNDVRLQIMQLSPENKG
jgi:hypothetical protein